MMERYWCKSKSNILNGEGFLRERSTSTEPFYYKEEDILTWDEISHYKSIVLLGEAGAGKSTAVINEAYKVENAIYFNLEEYSDESRLINDLFLSDTFTEPVSLGKPVTLFLDSFDAVLKNIKTLPLIIKRQLEKNKKLSSLLSLRIICRSGYWTNELDEFLKRYFGSVNHEIFQITPLSKSDILHFSSKEGLSSSFIDDIVKCEVQPLAINPVSLKLLISEYKQNGSFSKSRSQLYEAGCKALCGEPKEYRQFEELSLSVDKRLAIASRIAALMVFCNKSHIDIRHNPPYGDKKLSLSDVQEGEEITDKYSFSFTQSDIVEVVTTTSLFSFIDKYSYSFYHWSYAEFLAARFVLNHEFSIDQIMSLITLSSDEEGMIVEQVKGTASWLGTHSLPLLVKTIDKDPLSLLTGDLLNVSNNYKELLVESLFDKLANITITDDWNLKDQYYKLKYPGLSNQIRPYLMNEEKHFLTTRVAIDIAEACELRELSKELLITVQDKSFDSHSRKMAIYALAKLGSQEEKTALRPYALEVQEDDTDDDIKGAALRATWPSTINTAEVFATLTPIKNNNLFGAYAVFINYILAENIENKYLTDALSWCKRYPQFIGGWHNGDLQRLSDIITYQAWENYVYLDDKQLFAEVILLRIQSNAKVFPIPESFRKKWAPLNVSDNIRHDTVRCLVDMGGVSESDMYYLISEELVDDDDFDFVINEFVESSNDYNKAKWARLLGYFEYSKAYRVNAILELVDSNKELKLVFYGWMKIIDLGSKEAIQLKSEWEKRNEWQETQKNRSISKIDVQGRLTQRIVNYESTENWGYFIEFFRDLTLTPTSTVYGEIINPDVTGFEAWGNLADDLKSKVLILAKTFLETHDDCYEDWFGQNILHGIASTGYKCLVLLHKYNPGILTEMDAQLWGKWAHVSLAYPQSIGTSETDKSYKAIIQCAYIKTPNVIIDIIIKIIISENKDDDSTLFILHKIEHIIDDKIIDVFIGLIADNILHARPTSELISYVFIQRYSVATGIAKNMLNDSDNLKSILVGVQFAKYCNEIDWECIMSRLRADNEFAEQLFLKYTSDYYSRENPLSNRIEESQIAALYLFLCKIFPPETDPKFEGAHFVGSREQVSFFRDSLLQHLVDKGTAKAVLAIELIDKDAPSDNVKFQLVTAKGNFRKLNWHPFIPQEFLKMSENGCMRVISSNADLLNLVTESLYRLEDRLQRENSLSFALWDFDRKHCETNKALYKPKKEELLSDFIVDHLSNDIQKFGVMSFREVQIRRGNFVHEGKAGERTDILVSYYNARFAEDNTVIIEVKGSWNKGVKDSLRNQLVNRYLKTKKDAYGLYLVGWFDCEAYNECKNYTGANSIDEAKDKYNRESKDASINNIVVKSFILDCGMKN